MKKIVLLLLIHCFLLGGVLSRPALAAEQAVNVQGRQLFMQFGMARMLGASDPVLRTPDKQQRRSFGALFQVMAKNNLSGARRLALRTNQLNDLDSKTGATPLTWAAQVSHPGMVAWLLDLGADVEAADGQGYSPLATAIRYGKFETARLLLKRGALADRPTPLGLRPLQLACGPKGSLTMARLLVEHGANPHLADNNGWTAMAVAAKNGHADLVSYLLRIGAHPDGAPTAKYTPLHWASMENRLQTASLLLAAGADPARKGPGGHTPLSWASSKDMLSLLKQPDTESAGND